MKFFRAIGRAFLWLFSVIADLWVIVFAHIGMSVRWSRRMRGWEIDTEQAFNDQVKAAARIVELHPHVREVWKLGRQARILAITAKMYDVLSRTTSEAIAIDCMTDSVGALGEVRLGRWIKPFRIELDKRRREKCQEMDRAQLP